MKKKLLSVIGFVLVAAIGVVIARAAARPADAQVSDPAVEDFVPTEELPADAAISFPVDI